MTRCRNLEWAVFTLIGLLTSCVYVAPVVDPVHPLRADAFYGVLDHSSETRYVVTSYSHVKTGRRVRPFGKTMLSGQSGGASWEIAMTLDLVARLGGDDASRTRAGDCDRLLTRMARTMAYLFGSDLPPVDIQLLWTPTGLSYSCVRTRRSRSSLPLAMVMPLSTGSQEEIVTAMVIGIGRVAHEIAHLLLVRVPETGRFWTDWKEQDRLNERFSEEVVVRAVQKAVLLSLGADYTVDQMGSAYRGVSDVLEVFPPALTDWRGIADNPEKLYRESETLANLQLFRAAGTTGIRTNEQKVRVLRMVRAMVHTPHDYQRAYLDDPGSTLTLEERTLLMRLVSDPLQSDGDN